MTRHNIELDFIFRRRSIRKFTPEPIPDETIELLLKAGMAAPSAHNFKPWHFIVIRKRKALDRIADIHPYGKMLYQAPLAIAVCGDITISPERWDQDCAAATENILLALPELGLGGVWIGYHPGIGSEDFLSNMLSLPTNIRLFCLIAIGHPAEGKMPRTQYDESRIHYEKF